ncbi:MAG: dihydroorotate dehydrogenase [Synergistaceae bacterium]|jgi:dihydroorotate dehydrogenase (NAD+) catalytic subunit|nr:dihydroorotate dehydrogenase [Synergistaceae bacterium]
MPSEGDLSVRVGTLALDTPLIAAAGVWPYDARFWSGDLADGLGAACTKAISFRPREGNEGPRLWETPSGLLNSIGLQNEGAERFVSHQRAIVSGGIPVIANVVMETPEDTQRTLETLKKAAGGLAAVELNISCPNAREGMAWGLSPDSAAEAARIAREVWKGRLWVKMTPQTGEPENVARAIEAAGADALVAGNTWLGMAIDMEARKPAFERVFAGLSGPAVFPLALRWVWQVSRASSLPVVGCGGVAGAEQVEAMLLAGARAVELGTALFRNLRAPAEIRDELRAARAEMS